MLKFFETKCDTLFERTFVLHEDGHEIGGASLVWVKGVIEVRCWRLDRGKESYADLLAGALLNAACNTEVERVRVPKAAHWARFGLTDCGDMLEAACADVVFDSQCKSCHGDCANCADKPSTTQDK